MKPESGNAGDAERLTDFVAAAKARGIADESLVALLRQAGWSERSAYRALSGYYAATLGFEIPARGTRGEYAGEAFMHLIAFIALGFWATALGQLLYALIERAFGNGGYSYLYSSFRESVAWQLATILVAFPIFAFVSRSITASLRARPESAESGVRKWLTYLALVIAAVVLIGDAIWFISAFLTNALTLVLVLRTLVLTALAGGIFSYYLSAIRGPAADPRRDRLFGGLAAAGAIAGLALGFFWIGSPSHASSVRNDDRRMQDLRLIARHLHDYVQTKPLPKSLNALKAVERDPVTNDPYTYRPGPHTAYSLCATFDEPDFTAAASPFVHRKGFVCFPLDASLTY